MLYFQSHEFAKKKEVRSKEGTHIATYIEVYVECEQGKRDYFKGEAEKKFLFLCEIISQLLCMFSVIELK